MKHSRTVTCKLLVILYIRIKNKTTVILYACSSSPTCFLLPSDCHKEPARTTAQSLERQLFLCRDTVRYSVMEQV